MSHFLHSPLVSVASMASWFTKNANRAVAIATTYFCNPTTHRFISTTSSSSAIFTHYQTPFNPLQVRPPSVRLSRLIQPKTILSLRRLSRTVRGGPAGIPYVNPLWADDLHPKYSAYREWCRTHWLIVMNKRAQEEGTASSKDELIDLYVKSLAGVVGSEEEAKKRIYNVSCRGYLGFGCELTEWPFGSDKLLGYPTLRFRDMDNLLFMISDIAGDPGNITCQDGTIAERENDMEFENDLKKCVEDTLDGQSDSEDDAYYSEDDYPSYDKRMLQHMFQIVGDMDDDDSEVDCAEDVLAGYRPLFIGI